MIKKILFAIVVGILLFCFCSYQIWAANTHSLDLERGSEQYAYTADEADLDIVADISMEAWINAESINADNPIMYKWNFTGGNISYLFTVDSTSKLELTISDDGTYNNWGQWKTDNAEIASLGVWYHVAVTMDISGPTAIFYVNGSPVDSGYIQGDGTVDEINSGTARLCVGGRESAGTPDQWWDGKMDDVRLWNDVRTPTEISDNYDQELVGTDSGLMGYWMLNNSAADEAHHGNGGGATANDLTLVGTPVYSTDIPFPVAGAAVKHRPPPLEF